MISPPKEGFFCASKKHIFNFIWATGWFIAVYATLLAYEYTHDDPLQLSARSEPDGGGIGSTNSNGKASTANLISWWRQAVGHIMLLGMKKSSSVTDHNNNKVDMKKAIASNSLVVFRESSFRYRPPEALPLDMNFMRRTYTAASRPHYPLLDKIVNSAGGGSHGKNSKNDHHHIIALATGHHHRKSSTKQQQHRFNDLSIHNYFMHNLADPRAVSQCGAFVFVDGSILGDESSGGYSFSSSSSSTAEHQHQHKKSYLFESFVHCARKWNSPSEIGKRIDEYFKSCPRSRKTVSSNNDVHHEIKKSHHQQDSNDGDEEASCVSPGVLTLALLKRRIFASQHNENTEHARTLFFDLGAGSEIMSTIATSALHGYRQSERLRRMNTKFNQQQKVLCGSSNEDQQFSDAVLAPPASVLPIDVASEMASATEATRITPIPSNKKLFSHISARDRSSPSRTDCFGQDPDRINISPISYAISRKSEVPSDSIFISVKSIESRNQLAISRTVSSSLKNGKKTSRIAPRHYQCYFKHEENTASSAQLLSMEKEVQDDSAVLHNLKNEIKKVDPGLLVDDGEEKHQQEQKRRRRKTVLLDRAALNDEADRVFARRVYPHVLFQTEDPKTKQKVIITPASLNKKKHHNHHAVTEDTNDARDGDENEDIDQGGRHRLISGKDFKKKNDATQNQNQLQTSDPSTIPQAVRTHPTAISDLLYQVDQTIAQGYNEKEFTSSSSSNKRKITSANGVFFADVGGTNTPSLECGMAVSQTEIVESLADSIEEIIDMKIDKLKNHQKKSKSSLREQLRNINMIDAVVVLRPFQRFVEDDEDDDDVNWCSPCKLSYQEDLKRKQQHPQQQQEKSNNKKQQPNPRQLYAEELVDRTIEALKRTSGVMISGCGSGKKYDDEATRFVSLSKKSQLAEFTLRSFLLGETHYPFCNIWMSSAILSYDDDENNKNNNHYHYYPIPTLSELSNLKMDISDRLEDDRKHGLADVENVALTTGLKLSSSSSGKDRTDSSGAEEEEDDLNNNIHDDDENNNNNKVVSANKKSNSKMSMSDPSMVGLIVLAILVAAYLIRGVCRNFKGASSVVAPQKQA